MNGEIEKDGNLRNHQTKRKRKKVSQRRPRQQKSTLNGQRPDALQTFQVQVERPEANERQWFFFVPSVTPPDPSASIPELPQGSNGLYRVTFVLGIPGKELFLDDINVDTLRHSGTSLLLMPPGVPAVSVKILPDPDKQDIGAVYFLASRDGRVANVQLRLPASNFAEAEREAFNLVMPILSRWSYEYDVALDLKFYEVVEEQALVQKMVFGLVGKAKPLDVNIRGLSKPEFRVIFAAYREAVNATNVFYQLLCYYKVIEGVKKLRAKRREATLAAGAEYRESSNERIPASEGDLGIANVYLREPFRPYLGQKFNRVLEQFRNLLRNAVAHLDPTGDSLVADDFEDVVQCERAVPVIRFVSRVMLRNELQADPDLDLVHVS